MKLILTTESIWTERKKGMSRDSTAYWVFSLRLEVVDVAAYLERIDINSSKDVACIFLITKLYVYFVDVPIVRIVFIKISVPLG